MRSIIKKKFIVTLAMMSVFALKLSAQYIFIDTAHSLLRSGTMAEWDEFAGRTALKEKTIFFNIPVGDDHAYTLSFVQYDVRQNWRIMLNDSLMGSLPVDGNAMRVYYDLPGQFLKSGENNLKINQAAPATDDILISELAIARGTKQSILSSGSVQISAFENDKFLPVRFTVTDLSGILQSAGTIDSESLAIRPGMIYTADGKATVLLPLGKFKIYATRGFEYGVDSVTVTVRRGIKKQHLFKMKREVETDGWVSMDPHIHTLTFSGHGDAAAIERAITIAGEGIEVAITTEHNKIVDYTAELRKLNLNRFYTVVAGDEVTTAVGHFNIFPLDSSIKVPDHRAKNWSALKETFKEYHSPVIILNHGRDIHLGFRPFEFLEKNSDDLDNLWHMPANAMEIINSGALLSDPMLLINDWFTLLNQGKSVTPIGASDSHDVGRYLIGQARTYVQTNDQSPGEIDVAHLLQQVKTGKVSVSFGLMTALNVVESVNTLPGGSSEKKINITAMVKGPGWMHADQISLYANGKKIREEIIADNGKPGVKWKGEWILEKPVVKTFYVVIASGAYRALPFWPVVKPFQPAGTAWKPYVMGVSGAVWVGE